MKKKLILLVVFLLAAASANAAMLWYEGFTNQTVGSVLTDDGNWSYSGSPDDMPLISSGSLSYGELQASAGNSITTITNAMNNAGSNAGRDYADQTGPLYASFLMRVHDLTGLTTEHKEQVVSLHTSGYNGIALRRNATYSDRFDILLSPNDASADFTADDNGGAGYTTNDTLFLVFGTEDADASSTLSMWINPTQLGGSAPSADVTEGFIARNITAQEFYIYCNHSGVAGSNSPIIQLDEIRVGTSYADVTPLSPGYSLSAAPNNPLWGSVSPTNGYFEPNTNITLTATASNHYHFVNWSGSISGTNAVTNLLMDANKTITANFEADPYVLTVVSAHGSPTPAGTVTNAYGTVLTNSVNTPVVNGFTQYICTGWTLTGNAPASGSSNELVMTLTNTPATLTWLWETNAITDPIIGYSPSSLSFSYTLGGAVPAAKTYVVTNIGAGSLTLSNLANVSWVDVSPATLSGLSNGQSATVTVSVVTNGLAAGTSNGVITLSSPNADNSPQQVSVQLGIYESSQNGWPVYGQNNDRTFYSSETVSFPLEKSWVFKGQSPVPTRTTISTQAGRAHFYPVRYDYAPSPVSVGGSVYLNAVTEEAVFCLDSATGATNWVYYAEGPVRIAPAVYDGKVYFGSDDGHAYCVNAADGSLIWKVSASTNEYRAVSAHRISSAWPVRTGVVVESNKAYFAGGTLPTHGCYLVCVDADDGELNWRQQSPFPMLAPILLTEDRIFMGTGRVFPVEYNKATGVCINEDPEGFNREMGGPVGHTVAGLPYWGPSENGTIAVRVTTDFIDPYFSNKSDTRVTGSFAYMEANQLLADDDTVYILHEDENRHFNGPAGPNVPRGLIAVPKSIATNEMFQSADNHTARDDVSSFHLGSSRGGANFSEPVMMLNIYSNRDWIVEGTDNLRGLVTANAIFVGGSNNVTAFNLDTGAQLWTRSVTGAVWELAFADGVLYAGTREGYVYAFENGASGTVDEIRSTSSPYPTNDALYDVYVEAAELAITNSGTTRGFCLVLGAGDGRLAYEIAQRSDLFVIGLETDSATAATARQKLTQAGVYGTQVVIHEDMDELFPHPDYFADLIVSEELLTGGTMPYSSREIFRMLRPYGGTVLFGNKDGNLDLTSWVGDDMTAWGDVASSEGITWKIAERGEPDGFASWNFQMADPGNSFASGDRLVGKDLRLQWIGEVNDELALDRHNLPGSPLAHRGRLFLNHLDHLTVVDAYNGTIIWEKSIEQTLRQIASHDAPNLCAVGDEIYVATSNSCQVFDARTGEALRTFVGPSAVDEWGYLGVYSNMLIASKQKDGASVRVAGDPEWLYEMGNGGSWPIVSKYLFAQNPTSGTQLWGYTNGVILNQSIAIGGTNIFFVESRNSTAMNDADGRVALTDFLSSQAYCVALDINTGNVVWEQALDGRMSTDPGHDVALFLSFHSNRLVSTGTWWDGTGNSDARAMYKLTVRDPSDGSIVGTPVTLDVGDRGGGNTTDHNDTLMRPACTLGKAFYRFYDEKSSHLTVLNLADGTTNQVVFVDEAPQQKGCTPLSVSYDTAYYRAYSIEGVDLTTGQASALTDVSRPSCWPSIIPAGGLLLMPEGSSGCFCGMAEQTSIALAPVLSDTDAPDLFNVVALDENTVTVVFDEALDKTVAEDESHYSINNGITVLSAVRQSNHLERVTLTVSSMSAGTNTLTVSGLKDLYGNIMSGSQQMDFESGATDTDEDGLPDSWEEQYFENSTAADPNEDSDSDGLSNYDEYIAGTSPVDPFSVLLVENIVNAPGSGYVVSWTPQAGRTYGVLWAPDLSTTFTSLVTGISYPQSSWTDTLHGAESGGFYKIEALKQ